MLNKNTLHELIFIRYVSIPSKLVRVSLIVLLISINLISCDRTSQDKSETKRHVPNDLKYILVDNPTKLSTFQLSDQNGDNFTLNKLEGKWTFAFFGYSHCPDVCPTTLMEMDDLSKMLANLPPEDYVDQKVQFLFVTIDPKRDTVEHLKNYIGYFNKTFTALTGQMHIIDQLATEADIFHKIEKVTDTEYIVDHGSALVLINPSKYYYARFDAPHYANEIFETFNKIKHFYNGNS